MTALTFNQEFGRMRGRFQRTLAVSVALHAALFAVLLAARDLTPPADAIIAIEWLAPEIVPPPRPQPVDPVRIRPEPAPAPELSVKEKLARGGQDQQAVHTKLAQLQPKPVTVAAAMVPATAAPDLMDTARATMAPVTRRGPPANLDRGPGPRQPAVALTRGPASSHREAVVVRGTSVAAARPATEAGPATRDLGGATLGGLVADRPVLTHAMPTYPDWATTQAVEATVTLRFVVLPAGGVKPNVQVQKTAGYQDFDRNAIAAIRQWRFAALTGSEAREQWGTITFRYRLND